MALIVLAVSVVKWESEEDIHKGLRRLTEKVRLLREEFRNSSTSRYHRTPTLPTEDERRLRSIAPDELPRRPRSR